MARRAGDPKVRYVGFRLTGPRPVDRRAVIEGLRRAGTPLGAAYDDAAPWLTRFDGTLGVVRCTHTGVDTTRQLLEHLDSVPTRDGPVSVTVETLGTSGTIRRLVEKHMPELADTGRR